MTIKKLNDKISMKERVLRFVEEKGTATFQDIQRFVVDFNYGKGTYDSSFKPEKLWNGTTVRRTPYRGYYCSRFYPAISYPQCGESCGDFMRGDSYLVRVARGRYQAVFDGPRISK